MNPVYLDALAVVKMASGHLCLNVSEHVEWKQFPFFADELLREVGGRIIEKYEAPDMRLWRVEIQGTIFQLVFDDFPMMVSLESSSNEADVLVEKMFVQLSK